MPSPPLTIVQPLSPRVAVLSSEDVIRTCEANGCRGLEELLRPWEGGTERVSVLSSTLQPTIHPTFPLRFVSFDSVFPNPGVSAPIPDMVVDMISSYVGDRRPEEEQQYPLARSLLLASRPVAAHETFNHPVGVVFAISSAEPDPLGSMKRLVQQQIGVAQTIPWLDAVNLLKFFVVVHDVSMNGEDLSQATELLNNVKKVYGLHSTLLVTNSKPRNTSPPPSPDVHTHPSIPLPRPLTPADVSPSAISQIYASALSSLTLSPMSAAAEAMGEVSISNTPASPSQPVRRKLYGSKLSAEDTQRLAALVRELVVQSLIPWMEARVREWNEVYHANRRGITGRLFGAGRKFFGSRPASPAPNAATAGYNSIKGYYPVAAIETLTRRLADFAFMLRDYRFASTVYDSLRRDYAQDRAIRYSAAATEMYGLSLLLSNTYFSPSTPPRQPTAPFTTLQHTDISSWLEQAVLTYYGSSGQGIQLDALRATVLYYEAWKMIGEWRGVGAALVRAAGDAEEVVGAVMIEEAAQADLRGGKDPTGKGRRRRAFNLVMAGRRYETAGLKSYSRRCLTRAAEIYRSTPWTAVKDRIEYSLGRQAYASGEMKGAVEHFLTLLGRDETGVPGSQGGPLQDMGLAYEQLASRPEELEAVKQAAELPTPVFDVKRTRIVRASSSASEVASTSRSTGGFADVETLALTKWDRKGKKPMRLLPDPMRLTVGAGEMFYVELSATNPLNASLSITDLTIILSSATPDATVKAEIETIANITLEAYETRVIPILITIPSACQVSVDSATFLFNGCLPCTQSLQKRGKRLFGTKEQRLTPMYGTDTSLSVGVVNGGPRLGVELDLAGLAGGVMYVGESVECGLRIRNEGKVPVEQLEIWLEQPGSLRLKHPGSSTHGETSTESSNRLERLYRIRLNDVSLDPGEDASIPVLLNTSSAGILEIDGLVLANNRDDPDQLACTPFAAKVAIAAGLDLMARIKPTKANGGYSVLVEAYNQTSIPLQLDKLYPISQYWQGQPIDLEGVVILPNQVYRALLPITAPDIVPDGLDILQTKTIEGLSALVQGKPSSDTPIHHPPLRSDFTNIDLSSYISSRTAFRSTFLKSAFPTIPLDDVSSLFPLIDPLDLDLALTWSIPSSPSARRGQSHIDAPRPSPSYSLVRPISQQVAQALSSGNKQTRTMYEETGRIRRILVDSVLEGVLAKEEDPVTVRIQVEGQRRGVITRGFDKGMMEKVNVVLEVRNRSVGLPVRWIIRLPDGRKDPADMSNDTARAPAASFVGSLVHTGTVAPLGSTIISCTVVITEPGPLELGGWTIEVETGEPGHSVEESGDDAWEPRMSWSRIGYAGSIQVVKA